MQIGWMVIFTMGIVSTGHAAYPQGDIKTQAASQSESTSAETKGSSGKDNAFLTHAAQGGEAEIELGTMAQNKAADAKVKEFGARMQTDHGNANAELRAIIAKKGVTIPGGPGPHLALRNSLDKLEGAVFDESYMRAMVDDHAKAIADFEVATKSPDPDVRSFAVKTLPTLRAHKKMADDLLKTVSSSVRSSSDTPTPAGQGGGVTKPGEVRSPATPPPNGGPTGGPGAPR